MTEFERVLAEIQAMHDKKQADYGSSADPFANVRASEDFGIAGWIGCLTRANDKMRRLQAAARGQNLKNESIEDSLLDLAVYAIIGLVLYRESVMEIVDATPVLEYLVGAEEMENRPKPEPPNMEGLYPCACGRLRVNKWGYQTKVPSLPPIEHTWNRCLTL